MKLTRENLEKMKGKSPLTDYVINYVLERWDDYDDKTAIFSEVLEHGCQSDTTKIYDNHKKEIAALLYDVMEETGIYNPSELFWDKWDGDPQALKNLLAWFAFEKTLRQIARNFEKLVNFW
jgi:hypothetical protein